MTAQISSKLPDGTIILLGEDDLSALLAKIATDFGAHAAGNVKILFEKGLIPRDEDLEDVPSPAPPKTEPSEMSSSAAQHEAAETKPATKAATKKAATKKTEKTLAELIREAKTVEEIKKLYRTRESEWTDEHIKLSVQRKADLEREV